MNASNKIQDSAPKLKDLLMTHLYSLLVICQTFTNYYKNISGTYTVEFSDSNKLSEVILT